MPQLFGSMHQLQKELEGKTFLKTLANLFIFKVFLFFEIITQFLKKFNSPKSNEIIDL